MPKIRIFTKKRFCFRHPDGGESVTTNVLTFQEVPEWVKEDPLFDWAVADGDLEVTNSKADEKKAEKAAEKTGSQK